MHYIKFAFASHDTYGYLCGFSFLLSLVYRPQDPVEFIAKYMMEHNPEK
jgi:hypothetical protein